MKSWQKWLLIFLYFNYNTSVLSAEREKEELIEKIVIVVKNEPILESEIKSGLNPEDPLQDNERQQKERLKNMAFKVGLMTLARESRLLPTSQELQEALSMQIYALADEYKISPQQLISSIDIRAFKDQILFELTSNKLKQQEVGKRINILNDEIDQWTNRYKTEAQTQIISIDSTQPLTSAGARNRFIKQLQDIQAQVQQGESFENIEKKYSNSLLKTEIQDLGWQNIAVSSLFQLYPSVKAKMVFPVAVSNQKFLLVKVNDVREKKLTVIKNEIRARHILITPSVMVTDEEAKNMLLNAAKQIKNGETSFEELAIALSNDPSSKLQGGDLGWAEPEIYVPEFQKALSELKIGELSKPIRSTFGWHLIQLLEKREVDKGEEILRIKVENHLYQKKFLEEATVWSSELYKDLDITYLDPKYIDAINN